jgi:hypothetical protein
MEATAQLQHLSISAKVMVHFADTVFPGFPVGSDWTFVHLSGRT